MEFLQFMNIFSIILFWLFAFIIWIMFIVWIVKEIRKEEIMHTRIEKELKNKLINFAKKQKTTVSKCLRVFIEEGIKKYESI